MCPFPKVQFWHFLAILLPKGQVMLRAGYPTLTPAWEGEVGFPMAQVQLRVFTHPPDTSLFFQAPKTKLSLNCYILHLLCISILFVPPFLLALLESFSSLGNLDCNLANFSNSESNLTKNTCQTNKQEAQNIMMDNNWIQTSHFSNKKVSTTNAVLLYAAFSHEKQMLTKLYQ